MGQVEVKKCAKVGCDGPGEYEAFVACCSSSVADEVTRGIHGGRIIVDDDDELCGQRQLK